MNGKIETFFSVSTNLFFGFVSMLFIALRCFVRILLLCRLRCFFYGFFPCRFRCSSNRSNFCRETLKNVSDRENYSVEVENVLGTVDEKYVCAAFLCIDRKKILVQPIGFADAAFQEVALDGAAEAFFRDRYDYPVERQFVAYAVAVSESVSEAITSGREKPGKVCPD